MTLLKVPVNAVTIDDNNKVKSFNLEADAMNGDWIRAARLLKEGKTEELKKLENTPGFYVIENNEQ